MGGGEKEEEGKEVEEEVEEEEEEEEEEEWKVGKRTGRGGKKSAHYEAVPRSVASLIIQVITATFAVNKCNYAAEFGLP